MKNGIEIRPNGVKITKIGKAHSTGYVINDGFPYHSLKDARQAADKTMVEGYYWATIDTARGTVGSIALVLGKTVAMNGCSFHIDKFYFGENPKPIHPPKWILEKTGSIK